MSNRAFMRLESTATQRALQDLAMLTRKDCGEILRDHAQMMGRYLAESTAPFTEITKEPGKVTPEALRRFDGASKHARRAGEAAVARDIGRVYKSTHLARDQMKLRGKEGAAMAKAFAGMCIRGEKAQAQDLLRRSGIPMRGLQVERFDGGISHNQKRDKRGRINKGYAPTLIMDFGKIKRYTKIIQQQVGYTKSGWTNAAKQIAGRGLGRINGWIKDKTGAGSGEDDTQNTAYPTIRLTNHVEWVTEAMPQSFHDNAMESFDRSLRVEVEKVLGSYKKKHNL